MTLLVKNECDIIEDNINFHLNAGVDHIIVTDNNSDDGTRDILSDYSALDQITVIDEFGDDYSQHIWVTRMAHIAAQKFRANWIINNDADEFWTHPSESLQTVLKRTRAHMLRCERRNMVYASDDIQERSCFDQMVYRANPPVAMPTLEDIYHDPLPAPYFCLALPPKALLKSQGLVAIHQGNHSAEFIRPVKTEESDILVYHYPFRSKQQFEKKILEGAAAYARNSDLPERVGWHWRRFGRTLLEQGFEKVTEEVLPDKALLEKGLENGSMIIDETMRAHFRPEDV